jgi:hypothetical protein
MSVIAVRESTRAALFAQCELPSFLDTEGTVLCGNTPPAPGFGGVPDISSQIVAVRSNEQVARIYQALNNCYSIDIQLPMFPSAKCLQQHQFLKFEAKSFLTVS